MTKSKIKLKNWFKLAFVLLISLISFTSIQAFAASSTQNITIHKKALTESIRPSTPIMNTGDIIADFPGTPLSSVEFTAYDVTEEFDTLKKSGKTTEEAYEALKSVEVTGKTSYVFPMTNGQGEATLPLATESIVAGKNKNTVYLLVETQAPTSVIKADNIVIGLPFYDSDGVTKKITVHLYPKNYQDAKKYQFTKYGVTADGANQVGLAGVKFALKNTANKYLVEAPLVSGLPDFSNDNVQDASTQLFTSDSAGKIETDELALETGIYYFEEVSSVGDYHMTVNSREAVKLEIKADRSQEYTYYDLNGSEVSNASSAEVYNFKKPSVTKTVDENNVDFDQILNYTSAMTIPMDADSYSKFDLVDTPDAKLELVTPLANIKANITDATGQKIALTSIAKAEGTGFRFSFFENAPDKELILANPGKKITLTYQMKVREGAQLETAINNRLIFDNTLIPEALPKPTDPSNPVPPTDPVTPPSIDIPVYTYGKKFVKVDVYEESKTLTGAEFLVLREKDGGVEYRTSDSDTTTYGWTTDKSAANRLVLTSNTNGEFEISGLAKGDYQLEEIKAPQDYQLPETPIFDFTVTENSYSEANQVLKVPNSENGILPSTGGKGIYLIIAAGIVLFASGSFYFYKRRIA